MRGPGVLATGSAQRDWLRRLERCRVWRLARDTLESDDTIQISYEVVEEACRNCPAGLSYEDARRQREQAAAAAPQTCAEFVDLPPQVLRAHRNR